MEKQSVLYTAACIEAGRLKANTTGEHHWGPDDLNDKKLMEELEQFMTEELITPDDENPASAASTTAIIRVFRACSEPWEKNA